MDIATTREDSFFTLALSGRMDATTTTEFDLLVQKAQTEGQKNILVDMHDLVYISSAGLRSLLGLAKSLKAAQGKLIFCSLQPMVAEVFHISGFDRILMVLEDKTAALAAFKA